MREHEPLLESPPSATTPVQSRHSSSDSSSLADHEPTKSQWYLILLTIAIGGLQIAWSVEMASISPFLLSLGLSKSLLALVWIAGPLSGTLVQPYIGVRSDNSRLRWGRRRPFIVGGAIATMISLLLLAWTREVVAGVLGVFGIARDSAGTVLASQMFAVTFVYILDFAINVIQAAIRAFIVDCAPTHQQEDANAWASRISGMGNIIAYFAGHANLPKALPFFGDTQFKVFVAITCIGMTSTVALSCATVSERDPRLLRQPTNTDGGIIPFFKALYDSMRRLPKQVRRVCQVQLFAWIGWFPFLFYITTYVGGIYAEPFFEQNQNLNEQEINAIMEHGTRIGTFALLIFAITTFASSVLLPFIIAPSYRPIKMAKPTPLAPSTPSATHSVTAPTATEGGYFSYKPALPHTRKHFMTRILPRSVHISSLTLRRAWLISHLIFAVLMWLTFLVHSTTTATILVGLIGVPWALTNWAPFALIAAEISKQDAIRRGLRRPRSLRIGNRSAQEAQTKGDDAPADEAGVVLGIHNVAIAAPQVVATLVSSAMFSVLQKRRGMPGDNSVAWVLRFGGICALGAAWATKRVAEAGEDEDDYDNENEV